MMGTRHATRAVLFGTMNDNIKPTTIAPITVWFVFASTFDSTSKAMRRSRPVAVIAAAMKQAAATSATALFEKPDKASPKAALVPMSGPNGLAASGAYASKNTISAPITTALTA